MEHNFDATKRYLADLANPPAVQRIVSIKLGWRQQVHGRSVKMDDYFQKFQDGKIHRIKGCDQAAAMYMELAQKVLRRVLDEYPLSEIVESLSMETTKSDLPSVGYPDVLQSVRACCRLAAQDGFSYDQVKEAFNEGYMFKEDLPGESK